MGQITDTNVYTKKKKQNFNIYRGKQPEIEPSKTRNPVFFLNFHKIDGEQTLASALFLITELPGLTTGCCGRNRPAAPASYEAT
ncbi:MAG: hypothetical protein INR73_11025 [Williamsia sp.]|nr:hypothetical protein [Williamsia sp.]